MSSTKFSDTPLFFFCPGAKCTGLTFGDLFKLMIPVGWMLIAIMSVLSYAIVPDEPQWASASVVALSTISGIGLVLAIYGFHRTATSFAIEENYNCADNEEMSFEGKHILMIVRREMRKQSLRTHAVLSTVMAMASIGAAIFFGDFASELDKCTHESCGSDVAWSGMGLFVSTLWMGVTHLGYRDLRNVLEMEATMSRVTLTIPVKDEENTFKTVDFEPDSPAEEEEGESSDDESSEEESLEEESLEELKGAEDSIV